MVSMANCTNTGQRGLFIEGTDLDQPLGAHIYDEEAKVAQDEEYVYDNIIITTNAISKLSLSHPKCTHTHII